MLIAPGLVTYCYLTFSVAELGNLSIDKYTYRYNFTDKIPNDYTDISN